jgi:hypothetical protein
MTKLSPCIRRKIYGTAGALLLSLAAGRSALAQVVPPARYGPQISVFTEFTDGKPDLGNYGDLAVYGFTIGGFTQSSHILGTEMRGTMLRAGGWDHEETALIGPRAAFHFSRISPYLALLGGGGHSWWYSNAPNKGPKPTMQSGIGLQWTAVAGIDFYMNRQISIRVGELSYSNVYVGSRTLTPVTASAGVVFRPRWLYKRPY